MASDLRIRVGGVTAALTVGSSITDQQVGQALLRYARSLGISTEGTNQEQLTRILQHWVDDVKRRAKEMQRAEDAAQRAATLEATLEADNNL